MLCAKFQNDWITEMDAMDEHDFTTFEFKMRISNIATVTAPWIYVLFLH